MSRKTAAAAAAPPLYDTSMALQLVCFCLVCIIKITTKNTQPNLHCPSAYEM